ncbi:MAG: hypothetical protein HC933_06105 [Pleurocapsa sp. SU_196_0]|nr:hypothetical protein [Pleurocapsa sp. SU_196_0]
MAGAGAGRGPSTNYGVSNAEGVVRGSTTFSAGSRTLKLEAVNVSGSTSATVTNDGTSDVEFPPITVPLPAPIAAPDVLIPQPTLDPGTEPSGDPCADNPVSAQYFRSSNDPQLDPGEVLLDPQALKRIVWDLPDPQHKIDPATIRAFLDEQEITGKLLVSRLCRTNHYRVVLEFLEPLRKGKHDISLIACQLRAAEANALSPTTIHWCGTGEAGAGVPFPTTGPATNPDSDILMARNTSVRTPTLYAPNIAVAVVPDSYFSGYTREFTPSGAMTVTVGQSQASGGFTDFFVPVTARLSDGSVDTSFSTVESVFLHCTPRFRSRHSSRWPLYSRASRDQSQNSDSQHRCGSKLESRRNALAPWHLDLK